MMQFYPTCRTQRRLQQRQGRIAGRSFRHGGVAKKIADEREMNNSKNKMDDKLITYLIDIWYRSSIHILLTSIWMTYLIDIEYRCGIDI